jgi:uncharacterized membrane protein (DUF485 family)
MPPSREEFDAWLRVEIWVSLAFLALVAAGYVLGFGADLLSAVVGDQVDRALWLVVGGCATALVAAILYVRRLGPE